MAGVSLETIKRLERIRGVVDANSSTLKAIAAAFQELGIAFAADSVSIGVSRVDPSGSTPANVRQEPVREPTFRIIYCSTAVGLSSQGYWEIANTLAQLTEMAGITGYLAVCDNSYLHLLEGGRGAVRQFYAAIVSDPRHKDLKLIQATEVAGRLFDNWTGHDEILRHDDPVFDADPAMTGGFKPRALSPAAALGLLSMLRDDRWARANEALKVARLA